MIYILSPLFYLSVAMAGRHFTGQGTESWYETITKPAFTPPGTLIGIVWTLIYIMTAISLIMYWTGSEKNSRFWFVLYLYVANGIVNAAWSCIFFSQHKLGLAVLDAALIWMTVLLMIILTWRSSRTSSLLLIPYLGWVSFALYLTYRIYQIN